MPTTGDLSMILRGQNGDFAFKLYCAPCNELHYFAPGETERLIYALQGWEYDSRKDRPANVASEDCLCLRATMILSHDQEMYGEWTDGLVEQRKEHVGR